MSDELMNCLKNAINKINPSAGKTNAYSPVRQPLKKYKGSLVVFNDELKEFQYY